LRVLIVTTSVSPYLFHTCIAGHSDDEYGIGIAGHSNDEYFHLKVPTTT